MVIETAKPGEVSGTRLPAMRQAPSRIKVACARAVLTVLLVTTPAAGALIAVAHAPAAKVEVAGQTVSVKPILGQDTTRLVGGALIRPEHAHIDVIDRDVGVDISADWNSLLPSDKRTRQYLTALWEDPAPQIDRLRQAARRHLLVWSLTGAGTGAFAIGALWLALGLRRRRLRSYHPEDVALLVTYNRRLRVGLTVLGAVVLVGIHAAAVGIYRHQDRVAVTGSAVFDGTSLEGTQANGLVAEVLPFLSVLQPNPTFYDNVSANLEAVLAERSELTRTDGEVVFVLAEDFEGVDGMARQVGTAASLVDATFIALSGDLTFAGRAIETYLIDTVDYYSDNRPVHLSPGLHDTPTVIAAAEARSWHVLDGRSEDIEGVRFLSFSDPRVSTVGSFGTEDQLRDPDVDVEEFVDQAIEETCAQRPDFVMLHDYRLGRRIAESGCADHAVLDGRSYTFVGPQQIETAAAGTATQFTSGSAGGHVDTRPDPGKIKNRATFTIFTFDPETANTTYAVVGVEPDASVTVSAERSLTEPFSD
jgi:hypothetical protein